MLRKLLCIALSKSVSEVKSIVVTVNFFRDGVVKGRDFVRLRKLLQGFGGLSTPVPVVLNTKTVSCDLTFE